MANCSICDTATTPVEPDGMRSIVHCVGCGKYVAHLDELMDLKKRNPNAMPRLSHRIRKMQRADGKPVVLVPDLLDKLIEDPLPSFIEQEDNFLLWLGNQLREGDPAGNVPIDQTKTALVTATVGAFDHNSVFRIIYDLRDSDFVEVKGEGLDNRTRMKTKGWQRYEEIRRSPSQAHIAFMAMPFNHTELDRVYTDCFKEAVREAGFTLHRLDEGQPSGLIDDQLRVRL